MQAASLSIIENMQMDKVLNMVQDTILLNFRDISTTLPKFRFVRIIYSRSRSIGHSLKTNPSITNDKYVQIG